MPHSPPRACTHAGHGALEAIVVLAIEVRKDAVLVLQRALHLERAVRRRGHRAEPDRTRHCEKKKQREKKSPLREWSRMPTDHFTASRAVLSATRERHKHVPPRASTAAMVLRRPHADVAHGKGRAAVLRDVTDDDTDPTCPPWPALSPHSPKCERRRHYRAGDRPPWVSLSASPTLKKSSLARRKIRVRAAGRGECAIPSCVLTE